MVNNFCYKSLLRIPKTILVIGLWFLTSSFSYALPLKTEQGNNIENWVHFPNGVYVGGFQILPPGLAQEDGSGPPPRITDYVPVSDPDEANKKKIIEEDKKTDPTIEVVEEPTVSYDCHGLTFKDKKLWIDNSEVDKILKDQGWTLVNVGQHQVGDIVIYRKNGKVTHSGIVKEVQNGTVTRVRSKWGMSGEYIHDPKVDEYGNFEVFTGGKPIPDPPIDDEDVNVFNGLVPPPLKPELTDPLVNSQAPTRFNDMPIPKLISVGNCLYSIQVPFQGLQIRPGDTFTIYVNASDAKVMDQASGNEYGKWVLDSITSDKVTFKAESKALVTTGFTAFRINSLPPVTSPASSTAFGINSTGTGEIIYIEDVAGSMGRLPESCEKSNLVELISLTADLKESQTILEWETGTEIETAGFRLWRGAINEKGELTDLTAFGEKLTEIKIGDTSKVKACDLDLKCLKDKLGNIDILEQGREIKPKGSEREGARYSYIDTNANHEGWIYYYLLEDLDANGNKTFHWDHLTSIQVK